MDSIIAGSDIVSDPISSLQDAVLRTARAAGILGIRGLLAHALSEEAKTFYERHGFVASPTQPLTQSFSVGWACLSAIRV